MTSPADLQRVKVYGRTHKSLPILCQEKKPLLDVFLIPINKCIDLAIITSQQPTEPLFYQPLNDGYDTRDLTDKNQKKPVPTYPYLPWTEVRMAYEIPKLFILLQFMLSFQPTKITIY